MDCSLTTWPSITQFDDFAWMGFADIDPLENLDRNFDNDFQFNEISYSNQQESKPSLPATAAIPCNDTPAQTSHTHSGYFYKLTSSESLVAERWESMNGAELASVLDTLPPNEDTSTTAEDMYDLYNDGILMQPEPQLASDMDVFMSDSMSEVAEANTKTLSNDNVATNVSSTTPDVSSLSSSQEDVKCEYSAGDDDSSASINVSQTGMHNPMPSRGDSNTQHVNMLESGCGLRVNMAQTSNCYPFTPMRLPGCGDPSSSMMSQQHDCVQPGVIIQWPKAQSTSANSQIYDREKVVHHSNLHIGDGYPATLDQQARLAADAARVTSELKRNRAQASRARRLLASQRRAKKYPLQKLIRMSSSPSSARDRLDQNLANSASMPHQPLNMVSQNQFSGQPLSRNALSSQVPSFLPAVLQGPNLASSHELMSHSNPVQGVPYYCYQHPSVAPAEDNHASSGNSTVQSTCSEQDVQSLSTAAFSHMTNSSQMLDAAMLKQLQSILSKMSVDMRLCIRDALYRLARSAKHRQRRTDSASGSASSSSHTEEAMETNTNSIDRWIVNILFCKQPTAPEANSQSYPVPSQAPDHSIESANMNSVVQQWNSCGSSVNLQDRPLHVVTGL
eukprot:c23564_g1_i1 orf=546-2402(-)